jgi:hypothetical protein
MFLEALFTEQFDSFDGTDEVQFWVKYPVILFYIPITSISILG